MIFILNIFINHILSFSLVGLWTIRVKKSPGIESIVYSLTLARKGYDNHPCHNKPQREMGWSVDDIMPRRDGLRILRILRNTAVESWHWTMKEDSWVLCHWGRQLGSLPLMQTVEIGDWTMEAKCWVSTTKVEKLSSLPLGHRVGFGPLKM